ncbi:MAG: iron permease, partial [Planctomycetaceae bacterium]
MLIRLIIVVLIFGGTSSHADEVPVAEPSQTAPLNNVTQYLLESQGTVSSPVDRTRIYIILTGYCAAIMAASVGGGWLPSIFRLTHTRMQTTISFVGGLMLGIAVFHLLPHSVHGDNSIDDSVWWMMAGILTMFLLIRCFHFHHHGPLEIST